MAEANPESRPAWQTDDLEDAWIDQDDGDIISETGSCSISLTEPLVTYIKTLSINDSPGQETSYHPSGTFLVRHDVPPAPLLPRTPARNKKSGLKDFFSPLALERMFEPPSPHADAPQAPHTTPPAHLIQELPVHTLLPQGTTIDAAPQGHRIFGDSNTIACRFTFSVPRATPPTLNRLCPSSYPQAQSTPGPDHTPGIAGNAPASDPRLRLFQFHYDTFTREHLSAVVDSIAISTPSADSRTPNTFARRMSRVSETATDTSNLRSTKRVKLSPPSEYCGEGEGAGATISRPRTGRDYVQESRSLMQQIKQARETSTSSPIPINQTLTGRDHDPHAWRDEDYLSTHHEQPHHLEFPREGAGPSSSSSSPTAGRGTATSLAYRQQAAELMAQIKSDMDVEKRIVSGDTQVSLLTRVDKASVPSSNTVSVPLLSFEKENLQQSDLPRTPSKPALKPTVPRYQPSHKASPQKHSRKASGSADTGQCLAAEVSRLSLVDQNQPVAAPVSTIPQISVSPFSPPNTASKPARLGPTSEKAPPFTSNTLRIIVGEDLNRLVSSSTASGTTLTAGSSNSRVKHPAPGHIRRIAPNDVPALPERVGKMVFDKGLMKWVKATAKATAGMTPDERRLHANGTQASADSEDPFKDIESLSDSRGTRNSRPRETLGKYGVVVPAAAAKAIIGEDHSEKDEEEAELMSFAFDNLSSAIVHVMTGMEYAEPLGVMDDGQNLDAEPDHQLVHAAASSADEGDAISQQKLSIPGDADALGATPVSTRRKSATPIRSVLKSANATPVSALKDASRRIDQTPTNRRRPRRSVSFSDGKREGQIRGIGRNASEELLARNQDSTAPSLRSKRIMDMMDGLENSDSDSIESPLKMSSSSRPPSEELQPLSARQPNKAGGESSIGGGRRILNRSHSFRHGRSNSADATFLTECSFAVAHDRLVQVITDVQPFEPYWEDLPSINLSGRTIESVARLKEFLPKLDELNLNSNQIAWLSGIPSTVRTLSVASNKLTEITSFGHLHNLESLDISNNDINSLRQLQCLRHLQELRADGNSISSLEGLEGMKYLVKLSVQGNRIRTVDLGSFQWPRLQMMNASRNRLEEMTGLETMSSLISLNLEDNRLENVDANAPMPKLRILRVSGNRLRQLNAGPFPNLRTLYADNNLLTTVANAGRLIKLENISLRNQSGRAFNLSSRDVRDVKRLYLSGNSFKNGFLADACYNLVYMELAACRLTSLPENLGRLVPNLRTLNLNYNFLEEVARSLEGLKRLTKLTIIGSRLKSTKAMIRLLQGLPEMETLDLRMNPCTLGWYLPLLVKEMPGTDGGPPEGGKKADDWQEMDTKFRRDLPNEAYLGRLAYRGLVMRACSKMRRLDGVDITEKERTKAMHVLTGIARRREEAAGLER